MKSDFAKNSMGSFRTDSKITLCNNWNFPVIRVPKSGPWVTSSNLSTDSEQLRDWSYTANGPLERNRANAFCLAAVDHFSVGTFWRKRYEADVTRGVNPVRWTEYSISASLMIVLIAMLAGVTNVVALLAIFGVNAAMILFGLVMERLNLDRTEVDWTPFIFGSILGALPWILIAIQFALSESEAAGVPGFVYGIFVSLFILFNGFAINMWLTYRGNGHWKDPLFAERVYIMLSFVAKTALAWQVYAGALAGS